MTTPMSLVFPDAVALSLCYSYCPQYNNAGTEESSSNGHWNSSSTACSQSSWVEQIISATDFQELDRHTFGTFYWDFVQEGRPNVVYCYATDCCLRFPINSNAQTCCGHPVLELRRGGAEHLCFSSLLYSQKMNKQISKRRFNPSYQ